LKKETKEEKSIDGKGDCLREQGSFEFSPTKNPSIDNTQQHNTTQHTITTLKKKWIVFSKQQEPWLHIGVQNFSLCALNSSLSSFSLFSLQH